MGTTVNLYEDLRAKVDAAGFTMTAVCEKAGVSSGTPTHWAAGRTSPTQATYDRLVNAIRELIAERAERMRAVGL